MNEVFWYGAVLSMIFNSLCFLYISWDMSNRMPIERKKNGGDSLYNPFKKFSFLIFLLRRRYLINESKKYHIYDLFLFTFFLTVIFFVLFLLD